jgi:hypothetical protein
MFIALTNCEGKQLYVNMDLVISIGPFDGAGAASPYGSCQSILLCVGSRNGEDKVLLIHVREIPEAVIALAQPSGSAHRFRPPEK